VKASMVARIQNMLSALNPSKLVQTH